MLAFSAPNFVLIQGLFYGLGYGLLALGLVLVYRTNRVLNFAQGQIGVIAAVFLVKLTADFHFNYWFALVLSIGLAAFVGALSELLLRRLFSRPRVLVMVATIGLSYVLLALTALPFIRPSNLYKPVPVPFDLQFSLGPFIITPTEVLTLIVAPIVTLVLVLAVRFTSWGLSMRAMSENADSARLSGVWIRRTSTLTWTVAGALSAFTAILNAPNQTSALTQALSPDLLLYALTAALIGAMVNLTVAFIAGIGMGVFLELLEWNIPSPAKQQLIIFVVVMVVLLVRVGALRKGARTGERSTWQHGAATTMRAGVDQLRRRVSVTGIWITIAAAVLLPFALSVGNNVLFSQICIYAVIALSLTMLTGWAGQVSLGQFGLVAVGALVAVHLGTSLPLPIVMLYGGAVTALVAILVGLPALRMPGLFLAVTTLAFAIFMQSAVLATPCFTVPGINKTLCTGLPDPGYTYLGRPSLFGISLASQQSFAWFSLGVLLLSVFMVRIWRDRGVGTPPRRRAGQRAHRGGHGDPDPAHEAPRLRPLRLHGRLCGRVLRLRHPAAQQHRHHVRPHDLVRDHLHGRHRRPGLHSRGHPRRHLPRGAARALRRQPDDPVHHQRPGPDSVHPLPAGWAGRGVAPFRRRGDVGHPLRRRNG